VLVNAGGALSSPKDPDIPGLERFQGNWYHTGLWPEKPVNFAGKRVAVIGTGATGVQVIPEIAKSAGHLTVFQRTPNWTVPLRNQPLSEAEMAEIKANFPELLAKMRATPSGFIHGWDPQSAFDVSDEERLARFEQAWNSPGFAKWFGLYHDIATSTVANRYYCEFIATKVRERVKDPAVADKLIPQDHLFGTRRVPCETNYYEAYNRDNVDLVALAENPILEFTERGLRTTEGELELDIIVLATGYDAFTGALNRIDIRGVDGEILQDKWKDGPKTYMGIQVAGFPNLFIVGGPHGKGGHGNSPRCAEPVIQWLADLFHFVEERGIQRVEPDAEAETAWTQHVNDEAAKTMMSHVKSYLFGDNVAGKAHAYVAYTGSLPEFAARLRKSVANNFDDFHLT
jgi:cation diffusion facilitator CzcD-associated flavoprotein CzcO